MSESFSLPLQAEALRLHRQPARAHASRYAALLLPAPPPGDPLLARLWGTPKKRHCLREAVSGLPGG